MPITILLTLYLEYFISAIRSSYVPSRIQYDQGTENIEVFKSSKEDLIEEVLLQEHQYITNE